MAPGRTNWERRWPTCNRPGSRRGHVRRLGLPGEHQRTRDRYVAGHPALVPQGRHALSGGQQITVNTHSVGCMAGHDPGPAEIDLRRHPGQELKQGSSTAYLVTTPVRARHPVRPGPEQEGDLHDRRRRLYLRASYHRRHRLLLRAGQDLRSPVGTACYATTVDNPERDDPLRCPGLWLLTATGGCSSPARPCRSSAIFVFDVPPSCSG